MAWIYLLESPSKKLYVGQTIDIKNRFSDYKVNNKYNYPIYRAIRKYGWNNFKKIIFTDIPITLLNYFEVELIKKLNTIAPNGYNLDSGGGCGRHRNIKTKEKLSISHKKSKKAIIAREKLRLKNIGLKRSIDFCKNMSIMKKGKLSWNKGLKNIYSKETVEKISNNSKMAKKIICDETGIIYKSITDASKKTGFCYNSLARCCRGERKTTHNFHWQYVK